MQLMGVVTCYSASRSPEWLHMEPGEAFHDHVLVMFLFMYFHVMCIIYIYIYIFCHRILTY